MEITKMNTIEIMKNWKKYTKTATTQEFANLYGNEDTELTICDFCQEYNYNFEVYNYLYYSFQ